MKAKSKNTVFLIVTAGLIALMLWLYFHKEYLYLVLTLVILGVVYIVRPQNEKIREKGKLLNEYIVVIIGTLVGVFLALHLNNISETEKEKVEVVQMLFAIKEDAVSIRKMNEYLMDEYKRGTFYYDIRKTILQSLINSEKLVRSISKQTLSNFLIVITEIPGLQTAIYEKFTKNQVDAQLSMYNI